MDRSYQEFLESKSQLGTFDGFEPLWTPDFLFPFQKHLVDWSLRKGKSAIFADCGLGKTPMQLVWAENIVRRQAVENIKSAHDVEKQQDLLELMDDEKKESTDDEINL